jgi:prepilin peptidase CpaA
LPPPQSLIPGEGFFTDCDALSAGSSSFRQGPAMSFTEIALLMLFPGLMAFACTSDLVSMTISNRVSLTLVAGFICLAWLVQMPLATFGWHFAAGGMMLVITFGLFAANVIGGGDAKLTAATALWLGFEHLLEYLLIASVFGGALTLGLLLIRRHPLPEPLAAQGWIDRLHRPETGIPYGIALGAAGLLVYPQTLLWKLAIAG